MHKLQCPNCKGYKIQSSKSVGGSLLTIGLATFIFGFGIIFLLLGIIKLCQKTEYTCNSCGYKLKDNAATIPAPAV